MRTTLTLDPDVARLLQEEVQRQRRPLKDVVNDAIRCGLVPAPNAGNRGRFRVRPHRTTLRAGIEAGAFNRLVGELEDDAVVAKRQPRR